MKRSRENHSFTSTFRRSPTNQQQRSSLHSSNQLRFPSPTYRLDCIAPTIPTTTSLCHDVQRMSRLNSLKSCIGSMHRSVCSRTIVYRTFASAKKRRCINSIFSSERRKINNKYCIPITTTIVTVHRVEHLYVYNVGPG